MNNDLISRSELLKEIKLQKSYAGEMRQQSYRTGFIVSLSMLEGKIANIPAVDAEPVRLRIDTAEIDAEKGWYQKLFYCRCGQLIKTEMWDEKYCFGSGTVLKTNVLPKNCPNCGARMGDEAKE